MVLIVGVSIMIFVTACEAVDRSFQRRRAANRRIYLASQPPEVHAPVRSPGRRCRSAERNQQLQRMWRTISDRLAESCDNPHKTHLPSSEDSAPLSFAQVAMQVTKKQQQARPDQSSNSPSSLETSTSDSRIMLCLNPPSRLRPLPEQRNLNLSSNQRRRPEDRVIIHLTSPKPGTRCPTRSSPPNPKREQNRPQFLQSTLV